MTAGSMEIRVAIVGVGPQALWWARLLTQCPGTVVSMAVSTPAGSDVDGHVPGRAPGWRHVVRCPDIDVVLVCAPVRHRPEISIAAMEAGKHVFCDLPMADEVDAAKKMVEAAERCRVVLACRSPDRHRRSIQLVKRWINEGTIGDPMILRSRLGREAWNAASGQSPVEQLAELESRGADLARWFLGDFEEVVGLDGSPPKHTTVAILKGPGGRVALVESCLRETRGEFSIEVFGRDGYAYAVGMEEERGGERAAFGRRDPTAPFRETVVEFTGENTSRCDDWVRFTEAVRTARPPANSILDGIEALGLMLTVRESERTGLVVRVA